VGIGHIDRATDAGPSNPDPIGNAEAHADAAPNTDTNAHAQAHASPDADTDASPDADADAGANAGSPAAARSHIATERGGRCRGRDVAARRSAGGRLSPGGGDRPHAAGRQRGRFGGTF
jgi:hypothetical protein